MISWLGKLVYVPPVIRKKGYRLCWEALMDSGELYYGLYM